MPILAAMLTPRRTVIFPLTTVLMVGLVAPIRSQAQDVLVGLSVPTAQQVPLSQMDHQPWSLLLQAYVNDEGRVNYQAWKASPEAIRDIDGYLAALSAANLSVSATKEQQLAYWINAYNAVTIKGILREYPTSSIRNHTPKLWGYHIWKNLKLQTVDKPINLNDIEHEVLRKMDEPRIHFAIVCASISCPRLLNEAYTAERLEEQLDRSARHFFAQSQNFRIDARSNTVYLSEILQWFATDFGANQAAQLRQFSAWLPEEASRAFIAKPGVKVRYQKYDWGINEQ